MRQKLNKPLAKPKGSNEVQLLSLGQTDRQVVASRHKLNLGRDLRWVAKRTRKFTRKSTQVPNNRLMGVTQLALTWVGWPNGERLALTCVQIWSRPEWAQVIASQRKCAQGPAKRSRRYTQVFNLHLLASPCGQGLRPWRAFKAWLGWPMW